MATATVTQHADPQLQGLMTKIWGIRTELGGRYLEKMREIEGLLICALSRQHMVMIGDAGEAKTALSEAFTARIAGATYFGTLLDAFSEPDELYGPLLIPELEKGNRIRKTSGYMGEANIAYIDEVFKANSAVLNTLLPALNERRMKQDGKMLPIPLEFCVFSSNEMPAAEVRGALWDRITMRFKIGTLSDPGHLQFMHEAVARRGMRAKGQDVSGKTGQSTITLKELQTLQKATLEVTIPDTVLTSWYNLRNEVGQKYGKPSTRRSEWMLDLVSAHALLYGRTVVDETDLAVAKNALWQDDRDIRPVGEIVMKHANPLLGKVEDMHIKLVTATETCLAFCRDDKNPASKKSYQILETMQAIKTLQTEMQAKLNEARGAGQDTREIEEMVNDAKRRQMQLVELTNKPKF